MSFRIKTAAKHVEDFLEIVSISATLFGKSRSTPKIPMVSMIGWGCDRRNLCNNAPIKLPHTAIIKKPWRNGRHG